MPQSILEAIKLGLWDFEPDDVNSSEYNNTSSMPGTMGKLDVMAERIRRGLPLWHPSDRISYDDSEEF